ncbi:MAG: glucose-1-phosphate thymidylyltransferase [Bacteroidetes bacterium]|nr:MAG: glucose-1-phosphate thymidylyltransferase [Bacteroidota bacterium]
MNYILFGDQTRNHLLPFTFTRPIADIRLGILTIREKWEKMLNAKTSTLTEEYLNVKFPLVKEADNILINSSILPDEILIKEIHELSPNQTLITGETIIALRLKEEDIENLDWSLIDSIAPLQTKSEIKKVNFLWDLIEMNEDAILSDYQLLTHKRRSQPIPDTVKVSAPEKVFIEEGVILEHVIINATEGPVYIGKNAQIMDGAILRGPISIGEDTKIRMGAKIYGATSIGPHCKVGGEVSHTIIFGYTNKAHDGFLGHSVIGEWCNLGADTNTSNLKNSYESVRLWDYQEESFVKTELQFCGTFMGDHSKCGINTMFNTGTVVGVGAQIFGAGFMRNFIPSFSWGSVSGFSVHNIDKSITIAKRVFARRNLEFTETDEAIHRYVYEQTLSYRNV